MTKRLMIAGTGSGCGKTTVTCAILGALKKRGDNPVAFKCGPDYIDTMFHRELLEVNSRNLDLFLCGESNTKFLLRQNTPENSIAIIEGVMGFYDGVRMTVEASSRNLSSITDTPVVLVVSAAGRALSVVAEINGFMGLMPNNICAVILNHVSENLYPSMKAAIEAYCKIPVIGFLPRVPEAVLESRHLGLVTAAEVSGLREKLNLLAECALSTIDIDALLKIADAAGSLKAEPVNILPEFSGVRIAVARDRCFCFYYEDNLDLLRGLGAEVIPFSPLQDAALPDVHGLILGGGYPELCAAELSANRSMRESIADAVRNGLPTVAECGGFMYLCEGIEGHKMTGVISASCHMTNRLSRFGYQFMTADFDSLLFVKGWRIPAHEFHYSQTDFPGDAFRCVKPGGGEWRSGYATDTLYAAYPHLHYWSDIRIAKRFLQKCAERMKAQ